ncbi:MAG: hypothetical protein ACI91T_003027 [Natronomonas sp.]
MIAYEHGGIVLDPETTVGRAINIALWVQYYTRTRDATGRWTGKKRSRCERRAERRADPP